MISAKRNDGVDDLRGWLLLRAQPGEWSAPPSLTHLRAFPINTVKIERDFIAAIGEDHQARLIIQAIVQMGHSLGLRVVVEGVETEEQETFLRAIGCRHAQGFRYGRPMLLPDLQARFTAPLEAKRRRA